MDPGLKKRLEFDAILRKILRDACGQIEGKENCYFDPPENFKIQYPCIVYERSNNSKIYADNAPYQITRRYSVTVIDTDPDSKIPDIVEMLKYCAHSRDFVSDNLHHFVFSIFY